MSYLKSKRGVDADLQIPDREVIEKNYTTFA